MKVKNLMKLKYNWKETKIPNLNCELIDMNKVFTVEAGRDLVDGKEREYYILKVYLKED
jgi:hypothetical protein